MGLLSRMQSSRTFNAVLFEVVLLDSKEVPIVQMPDQGKRYAKVVR